MKTSLDCFPCLLRQALEAARMAQADAGQQRAILNRVMELLVGVSADSTSAETLYRVHRIVREMTGVKDPYRSVKEEATRNALQLVPGLREIVAQADDPLEQAVRIAIAGNIIDFAPGTVLSLVLSPSTALRINPVEGLSKDVQFTLEATLERVLRQPFAINDLEALRQALSQAERVLYLADNAGETVFDRVLVETLEQPVIYAVKGGPILNDATWEDAVAAGIGEVAEIVSTGSDAPGMILESCSPAFRQLYDQAQVIIAKGQANHEALGEGDRRLFFLLQVKCPVLGREMGVESGNIVLKQG
jgi:uncharacterized protein with ATP-grasp and redox domains